MGRRRWWIVPLAVALAIPCDLPRRLTVAMAVLATEIAMMMSSTFTQAAAASFYTARANRVHARAASWASQASMETRALPKNSAAAISTTLLALVLVAFDTPLGGMFPLVGLGVCLQAVQSRFLAGQNAKLAEIEVSDIQRVGTDAPPFLQRAAQTEQLSSNYIPSVKPVQYTSSDSTMLDDALPSITADLQREFQSLEQLFGDARSRAPPHALNIAPFGPAGATRLLQAPQAQRLDREVTDFAIVGTQQEQQRTPVAWSATLHRRICPTWGFVSSLVWSTNVSCYVRWRRPTATACVILSADPLSAHNQSGRMPRHIS